MGNIACRWLMPVLMFPLFLTLASGVVWGDDDRRGRDRPERGERVERGEPGKSQGRVYEQLRRERDRHDQNQGQVFEQLRRERYLQYREGRRPYSPPEFYRRGYRLPALPQSYVRIVIGSDLFFYWDGVFFRPHGEGYVVVSPPPGARVRYLPTGYISFVIGPRRYFYVNATYYLWDPPTREYVVVEKPRGAEQAMSGGGTSPDDLFVYPAQGQSEEQRTHDRFVCYEWAVEETGYDPIDAAPGSSGRADYLRALAACLEAHGYTVR